MTDETATCPCCGDPMTPDLVTCWECYRLSDRLTPGTHRSPRCYCSYGASGHTITCLNAQNRDLDREHYSGPTFTITAENIAVWDAERDARRAAVR